MRKLFRVARGLNLPRVTARSLFAFAILSILAAGTASTAEELPYLGNWSNGKGETLVITAKTIRLGDERALPYRDVTRATDGSAFELQITGRGAARGFGGNTLGIVCEGDSMKITAYASHAAYMEDGAAQSIVTWFKDDEEAEADE